MKKSFAIALSLLALGMGSTSMASSFTKTSSQPQRQGVTVTNQSSKSVTNGSSSGNTVPAGTQEDIAAPDVKYIYCCTKSHGHCVPVICDEVNGCYCPNSTIKDPVECKDADPPCQIQEDY